MMCTLSYSILACYTAPHPVHPQHLYQLMSLKGFALVFLASTQLTQMETAVEHSQSNCNIAIYSSWLFLSYHLYVASIITN